MTSPRKPSESDTEKFVDYFIVCGLDENDGLDSHQPGKLCLIKTCNFMLILFECCKKYLYRILICIILLICYICINFRTRRKFFDTVPAFI